MCANEGRDDDADDAVDAAGLHDDDGDEDDGDIAAAAAIAPTDFFGVVTDLLPAEDSGESSSTRFAASLRGETLCGLATSLDFTGDSATTASFLFNLILLLHIVYYFPTLRVEVRRVLTFDLLAVRNRRRHCHQMLLDHPPPLV